MHNILNFHVPALFVGGPLSSDSLPPRPPGGGGKGRPLILPLPLLRELSKSVLVGGGGGPPRLLLLLLPPLLSFTSTLAGGGGGGPPRTLLPRPLSCRSVLTGGGGGPPRLLLDPPPLPL